MFNKFSSRLLTVAAVSAAAISAHAFTVTVDGTYNPTTLSDVTVTSSTSNLFPGAFSTTGTYVFGAGPSLSGTADFTDGTNSLALTYTSSGYISFGGTTTLYGTWSENVAGTTYSVKPTGTWSASFDGVGSFGASFVGQTAPVPEPASIAVLGLGVAGLLIRRKSA